MTRKEEKYLVKTCFVLTFSYLKTNVYNYTFVLYLQIL